MHPIESLLTPLGRAFRDRRADPSASVAEAPELATPNRIELRSPAFDDGAVIPAENCGWLIGANVSPALTWGPLPAGTQQLVVVIEDLDSPGRVPRLHTVTSLPAAGDGIAAGALPRYAGPRPLPGHGPHRYRIHLYALDAPVDLPARPDAAGLPGLLAGHVLASGTLTGTRTA